MSVWDVKFKLALKADSWIEGKLGVDADDGLVVIAILKDNTLVKRELWCLEAFVRQRRNPKLPMVHCQFRNDLIKQVQPGIKRYNSSTDLIIDFALPELAETYKQLEAFEKELISVRKIFVEQVQVRLDLQASRKTESTVAKYKEILSAIQSRREDFYRLKRGAEAEQTAVARRSVLEANPDILASFQLLVEQERSVTEEVFWARHDAKVKAMIPLPTLEEPFFDFSTNADDDKKLAALLIECPYIQKRYTALVEGGRLNPQEFWTRLFHSRYFAQLVGDQLAYIDPSGQQEDNYFDAPDERESDDVMGVAAEELIPPDLDVSSIPENPNVRESNEALIQAGLRGTKLVTSTGVGGTATHLERGLLFSDRLNRLADRSLHNRVDKSCYFSVPGGSAHTNQLEQIYGAGDGSQLSAIASLMSLEASLNSVADAPLVNVRGQVSKMRRQRMAESAKLADLGDSDNNWYQGGRVVHSSPSKKNSNAWKQQAVNQMRPANRVERSVYAGKLRAAIADYKAQLDITSNETVAKCCYVKFTKILSNATSTSREQQLTELLKNETVLRYVEEVALVQNRVTELIHYVYDETLEKNAALLRHNLLQLQAQVEALMRHEIDTDGGGVMNSRTLCRPILYELEQAHKALG